jgi:exodeoxyribonuclease VII large subunit
MEDLWAFNTEVVARAIHASRVPIVSAVGHESDFTIADFVADRRAPTPSAAAAAVAPDVRELRREVLDLTRHARQHLGARLIQRSRTVETLVSRMLRTLPNTAVQRQRIDDILERGRLGLRTLFNTRRQEAFALEAALVALNPVAVLERGFAVITNHLTGKNVSSVNDVTAGDTVRVQVKDGFFETDVQP